MFSVLLFNTFFIVQLMFVLCLCQQAQTDEVSTQTDNTSFSCEGRPSGYYADIETGCQVYHMCDGLGRQFSYSCPNTTLFQQRMLICDHWYMVNCSQSETDYSANLLIGQRDKPFVDDNTVHKRTPRPDTQGTQPFIRGRKYDQLNHDRNLIGGDLIPNNNVTSHNDVKYLLPSHWTLELSQQTITEKPKLVEKSQETAKDQIKTTTLKSIVTSTSTRPPPPSSVQIKRPSKYFEPPYDTQRYQVVQEPQDLSTILKQTALTLQSLKVNVSTTAPPQGVVVEDSSTESSNLETSTTSSGDVIEPPSKELQPPKIDSSVDVESTTIDPPEKELLPPKTSKRVNSTNSVYDEVKIRDLRKVLFIPDYNFPLDPLPRPGYDSFSSYQVQATGEIDRNATDAKIARSKIDCPDRCDPNMLVSGTCQPCVLVQR